ncbi:fungal specific transcription factor domain-containing protein [Pochonia chlamydosporia 170]|uniref:Fungal specific transcription factor domain-containing protein n=1 Tax=Pochonia chlamydosporia 170 TaxID=1380566 RepID=A0A179EZL8_METCM|nr:fungal specific transcription factor domain-containing protein [Pochonia chlamydosporia 170]OAQ58647.2 fungal specific transcription factor domain-containing protein [Pochonia chlamydosporia 170]
MRDYVWKRDRQVTRPDNKQPTSNYQVQPSDLKGRFRLNVPAPRKGNHTKAKSFTNNSSLVSSHPARRTSPISPLTVLGAPYDPFDAYMLRLGPESRRLIHHYYHGCSMSLVAYNIGGRECLTNAREHPALFHSILYVVSLVYNLDHDPKERSGSLFHSIEAFRAINTHLQKGTFSDMTIAAVALMATKETLDGSFESASAHLNGLQIMVESRGGVENLACRHGKAVLWSDLCYSTVWDREPRFAPHPTTTPRYLHMAQTIGDSRLVPEDAFDPKSSVIPIIRFLRNVTHSMNDDADFELREFNASQELYDVEYQLQTSKTDTQSMLHTAGAISLSISMHLYLYLVIRGIPIKSRLVSALVQKLKASIVEEVTERWQAEENNYIWLLWILFIGFGGSQKGGERDWFTRKLKNWRNIHTGRAFDASLDSLLKRVIWHNVWCEDVYKRLSKELWPEK